MKNIQRQLPFPVVSVVKDKDQAEKRRRHLLIAGRPRRLKAELKLDSPESWEAAMRGLVGRLEIVEDFILGQEYAGAPIENSIESLIQRPEVIKVAIPPRTVSALDQIRTRLAGNATRPEIVRDAVKDFVAAHRHLIGKVSVDGREKRHGLAGRCLYCKIPFPPDVVRAIGYQEMEECVEPGEICPDGVVRGGEFRNIPATGLCLVFGTTRQGVITRGINWWLEKNK